MQGDSLYESTREFPVWGLLPKKETGVETLISKYNSFDGRGVVIAVFDSGVDPLASGLQETTDKKVKVIDRIDASGAGDVDTSTIVEASDGYITGLSGRKLKIPSEWVNPTGKYHIGVKGGYSLYPSKLKERIIREKKEKVWDQEHKKVLAEAQRNVQNFEPSKSSSESSINTVNGSSKNSENGSISPDDSKKTLNESIDSSSQSSSFSQLEKLQKEDNEAKLVMLKNLDKKYSDVGPSYDCVVYHDGKNWKACIDTSEKGELDKGVHLGEYRKDYSCQYLTENDQFTVSMNVHNDGNVLEIVGMCSAHGTHVSSIAAANFPDAPAKNGVAPGAQIVSIQIGDNRLGSMETGTALMRAMARVMENPDYKVDVINMSYGEHSHWCHGGRLGEVVHEVVNRYGITWVASAGNHGPALGTVGVPPDFATDCVIGVGAYVSPEMMATDHVMVEKMPGCPYTWSSRGPTYDGGRGVSICAPGGAVTSVPHFMLKQSVLMNGTSMASPHVAGCMALLISAMKQKQIAYSPYSIRRAIQNTALVLDIDVFAQGHGLIQVHKALEYLLDVRPCDELEHKVQIAVDCGGRERRKGIHLRNWNADRVIEYIVTIEPQFLDDSNVDANDKLKFNMEFFLSCDSSWVKFPSHLQCSYTSRVFKVYIDPHGLQPGQVYFAAIKGVSAGNANRGPFFEVPCTVIIPYNSHGQLYTRPEEHYPASKISRSFLSVPLEATYATVALRATNSDKPQRFTLHAIQLQQASSVTTHEFYKNITLTNNEHIYHTVAVQGNLTLEVCLCRLWSCVSKGNLEIDVQFHGIYCPQRDLSFAISDGFFRFDIRSSLSHEEVLPQAHLKHYSQVVSPMESKIEVLGGERDSLPRGRPIYQIILSYNFTIMKSSVEVSPKVSLLNDVLYESSYESQLWMIFDGNKQLVASGDAFFKKYSCKLEKGDYCIKVHVRHEKSELLEKLSDLPVTLIIKLSQDVKLDVYNSFNNAMTGGRKASTIFMSPDAMQHYYVMSPSLTDKAFKNLNVTPGCSLLGTVTFSRDDQVRKVVSSNKFGAIKHLPDTYNLRIFVSETVGNLKKKNTSTSSQSSVEDKKDFKSFSDYQEALRDFQTSWIGKLDPSSNEVLYNEIKATHTTDILSASSAHLQALDAECPRDNSGVISFARNLIDSIDTTEMLKFYGTKSDQRPDAAKIRIKMDRQKAILCDALMRLGVNLMWEMKVKSIPVTDENLAIDDIAKEIVQYTDVADTKVINFFYKYYNIRGFYGLATRLAIKQYDEKNTLENDDRVIKCYGQLQWNHAVKHFESVQLTKYPLNYTLF